MATLGQAWVAISPDLSGFAVKAIAGVKAALKGVDATIPVGLKVTGAAAAIAAVKSLMARSGLADFLDINVPVGRIQAQLQLLRRLLNQSNITDILGIDVDKSKLTAQLAVISKLTQTIPVNFDVSSAPVLAALTENVHLALDTGTFDAELVGEAANIGDFTARAQKSLDELHAELNTTILDADIVEETAALDVFSRPRVIDLTERITTAMATTGDSGTGVANFTEMMTAADLAAASFDSLDKSKDRLSGDITGKLNPATAKGGGFLAALGLAALGAGGWFGALTAKVPLFAGALAGIPFLGAVSGFHIVSDAILEIAAVVIPAAVALTAFGVAAASTVNDIVKQESAFLTISTALGTALPGVSSGLQHFTDSVKPQVWTLFGEALGVINSHTGLFQQLATGAGRVLDNLGARAALALGGTGLNGLIGKGVQDLQLLGDIIGNVFGILGNVLKVLPGYAQLLFGALRSATGALEALTANSVVQGLLGIGLALHGAVLWGGLAVTALLALSKIGLVTWISGVVAEMGSMIGALIAGEGAMVAFDIVAAINPFVLLALGIGAVVAGAIALVTWFGGMRSAADQLWGSIEKNVGAATTLAQAHTALAQGIQQANTQLASTPKYIDVVNNSLHGQQSVVTVLNPAWSALMSVQGQAASQQSTLTDRMSQLNKITGSQANTMSDLAAIGVKAGAVATDNAGQYANLKEQITGLATATTQLAGYTAGPALAAQNALTNQFLTEQLPAIQKISQAESNLLDVVTGGQTAFNNFQQSIEGTTAKFVSPSGLADAFTLAKGNLTGINQQSLAFSNTLYTQSIPSLQKLVGSLQQQSATTAQLTTVTATGAGQILQYTGNNKEARATVVALINDALGPGTVSLQTLNSWVKQNSSSLTGMNAIVAQSTIKAGTLAGVLQNQLNVQFHDALLQASGADGAIKTYTGDIVNNTTRTAQGKSDRATLINDLIKAGLSGKQATAYVDGLTTSLGKVPKAVRVGITLIAAGSGNITFNEKTGVGTDLTGGLHFMAAGGRLGGFGGGDQVPALLEPGETVVDKMTTRKFAQVLKAMGVPGFAGGGYVPDLNGLVSFGVSTEASFGRTVESQFAAAAIAGLKATLAADAKKLAAAPGTSGSVISWINAALKDTGEPASWLGPLEILVSKESGGNPNAVNPIAVMGEHASGLFQTLPSTYAQFATVAGGVFNPIADAVAGIRYIAATYGSPSNIPGLLGGNYVGYDSGGWLPPGKSLSYNGTGQYERVTPPGKGKLSADTVAIVTALQENTRAVQQQGSQFASSLNSAAGAAGTRGTYSTRR